MLHQLVTIFHLLGDLFIYLFTSYWLHCTTCGILVPRPGIEPMPPALEVQSPKHWTAREVPVGGFNSAKELKDIVMYVP